MKRILIPLLLLTGCIGKRPPNDLFPPRPSPEGFPPLPSGPHLEVLVLGDWGTGEEGQRDVSEAIARTFRDSPPQFVLTAGDNFYPKGVTGPDDPVWETHFEDVYRGSFWDGLVFFPILGNHDHDQRPEGQVQYSSISSRWKMPSRHYTFRKDIPGGGSVLFLALDTEPIANESPTSPAQREWADSVLSGASADWVVVAGHHPVATGGWHKTDDNVKASLLPLLGAHADLYVSGHNHSIELLETGVGTLQAVCGGGSGLDNPYQVHPTEGTLAAFTNGGWCYLRIWRASMVVDLYDREGGLQFRHLVTR